MMYNLFVSGEHVPDEIGGFLARVFDVPDDRVSVTDEAEPDSWDWDYISNCLVTCECRRMRGDLAWSLTLYAVDDKVPSQPSETELSLRLSRELRTVTLFPDGVRGSLRQLVTQDGTFMLARMDLPEEEDLWDDEVAEVSSPVPELPHAAIARFDDDVRYFDLPSPVTDQYVPEDRGHRYLREMRSVLVTWERLTVRMAEGWPPLGWYDASMYREALERRDEVEALIAGLPEDDRADAVEALRRIDARYRELTVDDAGAALVRSERTLAPDIAARPWYWHRRPAQLPWADDSMD